MATTTAGERRPAAHDLNCSRHARLIGLEHAIEHAAHFLPAQGPIAVFIHHNTLHAFEHLPFDQGVQKGARLFGCQPYLPESRYREALHSGRILPSDLQAVLLEDLEDRADVLIGFMGTRFYLRQAMLSVPLRVPPPAELRWFIAETDALVSVRQETPAELRSRLILETRHWILRDFRGPEDNGVTSKPAPDPRLQGLVSDLALRHGGRTLEHWSQATWEAFALQALWRICREGVHGLKPPPVPHASGMRHRDLLLQATGVDTDLLVNEVLIRFCSAYLDQGFSHWELPDRERGLWHSFCKLYRARGGPPDRWRRKLPQEIERIEAAGLSPLESIAESLALLGVEEAEWEDFITATLLALRGWAGMIRQVEERGDRVPRPIAPRSLVEYLAVRLVLERLAISHVAAEAWTDCPPLAELRTRAARLAGDPAQIDLDQRAFQVFQLAQMLGWMPANLFQLSKHEWAVLVGEIEGFPAIERRRILHAAYERRYRHQTLDALALNAARPASRVNDPKFQIVCCLDEREESFRRHIEEIEPRAETFGVAGFYNIPMYYRGAADAHYVPLCPIVVRPQHWVVEEVDESAESVHDLRSRTRMALGLATHRLHVGSRGFAGAAVLAAGLGALASVPLVGRVLFPRLAARIRSTAHSIVQPPDATHLHLERIAPTPGQSHKPESPAKQSARPGSADASEAAPLGFSLAEMTNIAERLLQDLGLVTSFAPIVVLLGHGSGSLNNPHNSAYNCGACGGSAGGPNARAVSLILNDPRVRENLAARGISIPADTVFVGGWHNTCNDRVTLFDLDRVPQAHRAAFDEVRATIEEACDRNAHERCRRFMSAPLNLSFPAARRHVEARAEDLAQTRPECGHATNAVAYVGRRSRTRGLFLDRRWFLTSYDPTLDTPDRAILSRLLAAVFPVCGGINLEYYFSYVDNAGYGCGTKLPHNVTSLLGVMDGAASDLRTGLPWQMVEIHDPVRLHVIIEDTPEAMLAIMDKSPAIAQLCRNDWVQLSMLSPTSADLHFFQKGQFVKYQPEATSLPAVASSTDWYRGWRDHLGYALIEPALAKEAGARQRGAHAIG